MNAVNFPMYKWTLKTISQLLQVISSATEIPWINLGPDMARTLEQKINEANDKLARLKARKKKQEARQYIVLGASLLAVGRLNAQKARDVLNLLNQAKMRDSEKRDLEPVIEELKGIANGTNNNGNRS